MSYPGFNAAQINGAASRGSGGAGGFSVSSLMPVLMGVPELVMHSGEFPVDGLAPVGFGVPNAVLQMRASSLSSAQFGTPRLKGQEMYAESLVPAHFGVPEARFGMLPGNMSLQAHSMRPVSFGRPSLQAALQVAALPSLVPAQLGQPRLSIGLRVQSLQPVGFGALALTVVAQADALHPARFGGPLLQFGFGAVGLRAERLGTPRLQLSGLSFTPESLQPVSLGTPALGGMTMRARTLCPVSFGRPALDRGTAC